MIISSLRTAAFRNLADTAVNTLAPKIFLVGENGQGKTNFLEALYFCAYASSFRGVRDSEIPRNAGTQNGIRDFSAAITAVKSPAADGLNTDILSGDVLIKVEKGKKTVFIDGKKTEDRKDLLSVVPCIVFCHEDMEFVAGSPERRRWFFDQVLSLYDPVYLDDFRRYRRALKSRNSVLRDNPSDAILDALDRQCALYGVRLMEKREEAARLFSEVFSALYEEVSGIAGMSVRYVPSWKGQGGNLLPGEDEAAAFLHKRRAADVAAGISLSGPHRDRYLFILGETDFTAYASTGQRRLLALLLRVAQARRYLQTTGRNPILLLDDVLLEMDGEKRRRFLSALPGCDQAFYTFLPEEPFERYREKDTLVYFVRDGRIEEKKW